MTDSYDLLVIGESRLVFTHQKFADAQGAISFAAHGEANKQTNVPRR